MKAKKLYLVREFDGEGARAEIHDSLAEASRPEEDRCTDLVLCISGVDEMLGTAVAERLWAGEVVEILVVI